MLNWFGRHGTIWGFVIVFGGHGPPYAEHSFVYGEKMVAGDYRLDIIFDMPNYHRMKIEGARYFFTVVTYHRRHIFTNDFARETLRDAIQQIKADRPFSISAFFLGPDHMHCIWKLPPGDSDYSARWSLIKQIFSKAYIAGGGKEMTQSTSRTKKKELGIWQRRFWEHRIRDEDDYWNHVHYIHRNPLKHGLVKSLRDWPFSSYHRFYQKGIYDNFDWKEFDSRKWDDQIEFNE